jgi:hypothetical protein
VHRDGARAAAEWALFGGTGEEMVSDRALRRWREVVAARLVGSAFSWLGPQLGMSWSDQAPVAAQLDLLLDRLTGPLLAGFRAVTGRAVLDKPTANPPSAAGSAARRVPGRPAPAAPPIAPLPTRPRGSWSRPASRELPRPDPEQEDPP